ncbi:MULTISPECIES: GNAT family N-acetyltransferase [unclassified Rhodococcus (in: high G+C Gram-positive bacteria)]|uniref:GNAT family N-acetyltransferase n=1 Tax=unclassified Rhodococcus (in: high G+C Gram-positive bacteria) TaxID=192944 RepID=UPI00163AA8B5|nr:MULTISPECIES: GNAT family N-acetyltransferase [unclassified Rhodococcus (in: high G+C Gram-positive bacteria)]MBC2639618.1 GNAT family N-acetyltransferase [Rhodococcus sp. 3A]MBC2895636.1 GNAT family N-acetyltransferase [Rhodococcus sp. 4CII]
MTERTDSVQAVFVDQTDPLAAPLLDELAIEYSTRYGRTRDEIYEDLTTYPAEEFAAPGGALLVLVESGTPLAGGAFRRYDDTTAELKRIWTSSPHRRRGLGRIVLRELEAAIVRAGYTRIFLTTGPRQPEAVGLYLAAGYTALFDRSLPPQDVGIHGFEKALPTATALPSGWAAKEYESV